MTWTFWTCVAIVFGSLAGDGAVRLHIRQEKLRIAGSFASAMTSIRSNEWTRDEILIIVVCGVGR